MKLFIKKAGVIGIMVTMLCSLAACGGDVKKIEDESEKKAAERVTRYKEDAKEAMDKVNKDTLKLTEAEQDIESE